jgi:hypothetical protein
VSGGGGGVWGRGRAGTGGGWREREREVRAEGERVERVREKSLEYNWLYEGGGGGEGGGREGGEGGESIGGAVLVGISTLGSAVSPRGTQPWVISGNSWVRLDGNFAWIALITEPPALYSSLSLPAGMRNTGHCTLPRNSMKQYETV